MAKEQQVYDVIRSAGFDPIEDRAIIVKHAPRNLSATVASFFSAEFYVLQMCEKELVMVPFKQLSAALKKEVALEIMYDDIKSVDVAEDGFNYKITIETKEDTVSLLAQQKELSEFRSSGVLSSESNAFTTDSWHAENLDDTLKALESLGK